MNELRELEIDSTLWIPPSKIINLLDFKPELKQKIILIVI